MTANEATKRATQIWGASPLHVHVFADGSADVYYGSMLTHTRHQLDRNGRVVCHAACRVLESIPAKSAGIKA